MTVEVDYVNLSGQLEQQELESPGGIASAQLYSQLLAVYLLHNDLANAKFLWKRIPQSIKSANPELSLVWAVGQNMWQRDFSTTYESLDKPWSETLKPIMAAVHESTRARAVALIAQAYSSISGDQLASFLGMPTKEAVEAAVSYGWQADAQTRMVMPVKKGPPAEPVITSEQQLARLTDFISFLEN